MSKLAHIALYLRVLALLACVSLLSCQEDTLVFEPDGNLSRKPGMNLSIGNLSEGGDVAPQNDAPGTRALITDAVTLQGTDAERTVQTLDVFLFDQDGLLVAHRTLTRQGNNIGGGNATLPYTGSGSSSNVDITELINAGGFGQRRLAVVANWDEAAMGSSLADRVRDEGNSLNTLEQMIIQPPSHLTTGGVQHPPFAAPGLLMYGRSSLAHYNDANTIPAFDVILKRLVARLDLKLSVGGSMASATTIDEIQVYQPADRAFMAPPVVPWEGSTMPPGVSAGANIVGLFRSSDIGTTKTIYLPENNLKWLDYTSGNATAVLVNIKIGTEDNWYRFWVNEADRRTPGTSDYHIKRNTLYQITAVINTRGGTYDNPVDTEDPHFDEYFHTMSYDVGPGIVGNVPPMRRYRAGEMVTVANFTDGGAIGRDKYPVIVSDGLDGMRTYYHAGDSIQIYSNITLYARLRPSAPRITLAADGTLAITYERSDAGLYFKFGSVVGVYSDHHKIADLRQSGSSDSYDAGDVAFSPIGGTFATWGDIPYVAQVADYKYHSRATVAEGKGDPCRLVGLSQADIQGGKVDNGIWRLPNKTDAERFMPGSAWNYTAHWWRPGSYVPGGEFPRRNNADYEKFLPAAGMRHSFTAGSVGNVHTDGIYYLNDDSFRDGSAPACFSFSETSFVSYSVYDPPSTAFPIRCVRQGIPRITLGTGSDGQPMLVLTDDPTDGGLLFKYGSTVGVYSGHHGNLSASNKYQSDTWDVGDVAFNYTTTPTAEIDNANKILPAPDDIIEIGVGYHNAAVRVRSGFGDPCRLVGLTLSEITSGTRIDNGMWRLPTRAEVADMMGGMDWTPSACVWESAATSPWGIEGFEMKGRNGNFNRFIAMGGLRTSSGTVLPDFAHIDGRLHYWLANTPRLFSLRHKAAVWENENVQGAAERGYMTGRICVRQ